MTEETLYKHFIKFGGIESLKIMPPKAEGTFSKNIAFINFLKPEYAKKAKEAMNEKIISGSIVKIKWGRKLNTNNQLPIHIREILPQIFVKIPEDKKLRAIIDKVAKLVVEEGYLIEKYLIERETNNPDFNFILYHGTTENIYYRWRVYSYAQGDTDMFWREEPFQFNIGGNIWHPPAREIIIINEEKTRTDTAETSLVGEKLNIKNLNKNVMVENKTITRETLNDENNLDDDEEEDTKIKGEIEDKPSHIGNKKLNENKLAELRKLLSNLDTKRCAIKFTMRFCYENIQSAKEITENLLESIVTTKKFQEKIAKLYLISDVLYNSMNVNIFNSWCYKKEIENILPEIFEDLNKSYMESIGRITSEKLKETILTLLKLWGKWNVLEFVFISGLEATFLRERSSNTIIKEEIKYESMVKSHLESYEDELLDLHSKNEESLKLLAFTHGLSIRGEISEIISRLMNLKEIKLRKEFLENEKIQQDKETEKKLKENLLEMDRKIKLFKSVVSSLENSYKKINEFDVDGYPIDDVELEFLNLSDGKKPNMGEIKYTEKASPNIEKTDTNYDEDLDGEPI